MPTFDFANIINKIVRTVVSAVANPVVILTAFAAAVTAALTVYVRFFTDLSLPRVEFFSLNFSSFDSDWNNFFCYLVDYETLVSIFDFVLQVAFNFIPVCLTFFVSLFTLYWVFKCAKTIRAALKDFAS